MNWVAVRQDADANDAPRFLTEEEKNFILKHFPAIIAADRETAELHREQILAGLREALGATKLCPSMIGELTKVIVKTHEEAKIKPGSPVGVNAAEAVGASNTQMTLSNFHNAGSRKTVSSGIQTMGDMIFARKERRDPVVFLIPKNRAATFEEVLNLRRIVTAMSVKDFVLDYEIIDPENLDLDEEWWYSAYLTLFQKEIPAGAQRVLRLYLNRNELYNHGMTVQELAAKLEVTKEGNPPIVSTVASSSTECIIDVYPYPDILLASVKDEKMKPQTAEEEALLQETFLEATVLEKLDRIQVKGIAGMGKLYPVVVPIWSIVTAEKYLSPNALQDYGLDPTRYTGLEIYALSYDAEIQRRLGLSPENLAAFLKEAGVTVVFGDSRFMLIGMPSWTRLQARPLAVSEYATYNLNPLAVDARTVAWLVEFDSNNTSAHWSSLVTAAFSKFSEKNPNAGYAVVQVNQTNLVATLPLNQGWPTSPRILPSEYKTALLAADKKNYDESVREIKLTNVPRSKLRLASEYIYAEVVGSNLQDIMRLSVVDKYRTYCNNFHENIRVLGCEASAAIYLRELIENIKSTGNYVHPANAIFITEFVFNRGKAYGATFAGIARQPGGFLGPATLERAGKVFIESGLYGRSEDVKGSSAAVTVGSRMNIGTGYGDIGSDFIENGAVVSYVNNSLYSHFERSAPVTIAPLPTKVDDSTVEALIQEFNSSAPIVDSNAELAKAIASLNVPIAAGKLSNEVRSKGLVTQATSTIQAPTGTRAPPSSILSRLGYRLREELLTPLDLSETPYTPTIVTQLPTATIPALPPVSFSGLETLLRREEAIRTQGPASEEVFVPLEDLNELRANLAALNPHLARE